MGKIWEEWEPEHGPGDPGTLRDLAIGWVLPIAVIGLAAWKVWDLIRLVVK